MTMNVLMAGCGNMGGALLAQWVTMDEVGFTVVSPSLRPAPAPVVASAEALSGQQFDAIVVAVKPQMIAEVMPDYRSLLTDGGAVISIAAATTIDQLQAIFPGAAVVRMMPNLPSRIGRGMTGLVASANMTSTQRRLAESLSAAAGDFVWVEDEERLDRLTAIAGCGSGYVFQMIESFEHAARALGFTDDEARLLVRQTMAGAAEMALSSAESAESLKESVMSKGGVTRAGVAQMTADNVMDNLMLAVVNAAYDRAREMAAGNW